MKLKEHFQSKFKVAKPFLIVGAKDSRPFVIEGDPIEMPVENFKLQFGVKIDKSQLVFVDGKPFPISEFLSNEGMLFKDAVFRFEDKLVILSQIDSANPKTPNNTRAVLMCLHDGNRWSDCIEGLSGTDIYNPITKEKVKLIFGRGWESVEIFPKKDIINFDLKPSK
jgi:hypothetical protein